MISCSGRLVGMCDLFNRSLQCQDHVGFSVGILYLFHEVVRDVVHHGIVLFVLWHSLWVKRRRMRRFIGVWLALRSVDVVEQLFLPAISCIFSIDYYVFSFRVIQHTFGYSFSSVSRVCVVSVRPSMSLCIAAGATGCNFLFSRCLRSILNLLA